MTQLTNEIIIKNFNTSTPFFKLALIFFGVAFLIFCIVYFIKFKRKKTKSEKKDILIGIVIIFLLIGIPVFKGLVKYNAINYSLKNNSWYVEIDTIERTKSSSDGDGNTSYYVYLTEHGKVSVSSNIYHSISKGDSVYVVIVKGIFGLTYTTNQIYPTSKYIYYK